MAGSDKDCSYEMGRLSEKVDGIDSRMGSLESKVDMLIEAHQRQVGMVRMGALVMTAASAIGGWVVGHWHLLTGKGPGS